MLPIEKIATGKQKPMHPESWLSVIFRAKLMPK